MQGGRKYLPHRSHVNRTVGVSADRKINRTMIHACAAADAAQHVAAVAFSQARASVVQQHDIRIFGAFAVFAGAGAEAGVIGQPLSGCGTRKEGQQTGGVFLARDDFVDSGEDGVDAGECRGHAGVAFVCGDNGGARIGGEEICAANSHIGGEEFLAEKGAGGAGGGFCGIAVAGGGAADGFGGFFAAQMHNRRDDVGGRFAAHLCGEFAEVGFNGFDSGVLERVVEVDFFGRHAFGFDGGFGAVFLGDLDEQFLRGFGVFCPQDGGAVIFGVLLELAEEFGHAAYGILSDLCSAVAEVFESAVVFIVFGDGECAVCGKISADGCEVLAQIGVFECVFGAAVEIDFCGVHGRIIAGNGGFFRRKLRGFMPDAVIMRRMAPERTIPIRAAAAVLGGEGLGDLAETAAKLAAVRAVLREEYGKRHRQPWVVAYSGGKDSTLLLQLVFEAVLSFPPEERKRHVHVVANDTLVESPPVVEHLYKSIAAVRRMIGAGGLPASAAVTKPYTDQTFWVNVIGRGYIPPTRNFRWCTDRLKIQPTTEYIGRLTRAHKKTVLLIGTRKAESSARKRRMEKHAETSRGRMNPHGQIENCRVFSPLAELSDNEVWAVLLQSRPPWGGTHRNLITLYRNAGGGECPLVLSKEDAPSCGTTSPRFGCWTCTVINKDRSLGGLIDSGYAFEALQDFREWLLELREKDINRLPFRRNLRSEFREDGSRVRGPFKMEIRRKIRKELKVLEKETGRIFLSRGEERIIDDIWRVDEAQYSCQDALARKIGAPVPSLA